MCVDLHKATCLHLPTSTARGIIKKFKTTGTVANKPGRGRRFISPPRPVRRTEISTCQQAVWEARKKPFLTYRHKREHLEFTKRDWDFSWDCVLWSDETKIELFGSKRSEWDWRNTKNEYAEKHLMPTVK
ncbi:hypothetical protein SRHO_G00152220 [Serrasalmus rhombeus]